MKKSILSLLLALALVLTACGGEEKKDGSVEKSAETSVEESKEEGKEESKEESKKESGSADILTGEAEGRNGTIKVEVTVEGEKITDVKIVEHAETEGIADPALEEIPAAIVEKGTTEGVEAVSNATVTSEAIIEAVNNALASK